jgi:prepilin-type N-terminal cleavage/methylation domain-containing protein
MTRSRRRGSVRQGVSHGRARSLSRAGVTLLELIVVIAMLGLLLAVAAPAFIVPTADGRTDLAAVLAAARRAAVLRGEPVTLSVDEAGAWVLTGDAAPAAPAIATGSLEATSGRLRVRVSPLGSCIPETAPGVPPQDWSAAGCGVLPAREVPRS